MTTGSVSLVLHSHLPYCRLAGRWPHGEEWFHEAMLECYLPLVAALRRAAADIPGSLGVTLNVTPILAEQLRDPLMNTHFREYLGGRLERAKADVTRLAGGPFAATARFHLERYGASQRLYEGELGGDIAGALRKLEEGGHIELATSAATHGYLPLLDDERAVRFQVETGVSSHVRNFGRRPRSFWLPECAYRPGLERVLEGAGIEAFFVETHLVTGGTARGHTLGDILDPYRDLRVPAGNPAVVPETGGTTFQAYRVGHSHVSVLARNERSGKQVWSASHGYPGDPAYREFHKKDDVSGLHYWRLSGPDVDLGEKQPYDAEAAAEVARTHAEHFHGVVRSELEAYRAESGEPGIVMASYDTELFGHWWLEGVPWLEHVIRRLAADPDIELTTASRYVEQHPPSQSIDLPEGSWGNGGDHRTWMNPGTAWTWPEIHARQRQAAPLFTLNTPAARQLARELLLLQSSDWQFLMTTGQAHDYAVERFRSHMERFDALARAMDTGSPGLEALVAEYEALDNPFPSIDPRAFAMGAGAVVA
jgi:1,4-alpha-glucan branching enzyme